MAGTLREDQNTERLFSAIASLETPEEARALLLDLCSVSEIGDFAQRLEVACMLAEGMSYVDVSRVTGASSTTVSRVSKCLKGPEGGYRLVLSRLDAAASNAAPADAALAEDVPPSGELADD